MQKDVIAKSVQYLAEFVVDRSGPQVEQEKIARWQNEFPDCKFTTFECAQMLNLRPADSDEAMTLITSLERFETDEEKARLNEALKVLSQ